MYLYCIFIAKAIANVLRLISDINRINPKAIAKVFTRVFAHQGAPVQRGSLSVRESYVSFVRLSRLLN